MKPSERPDWKTPLGIALSNYIRRDSDFCALIRGLAPDWFVDTAQLKKNELLELARSGATRPSQKTSLGKALSNYIQWDSDFAVEIRKLRQNWFVDRSAAKRKKNKLLKLARSGATRPGAKTELGEALNNYTRMDSGFAAEIRKLAPADWFRDIAMQRKKDELLELARSGTSKRPSKKTSLGKALSNYIRRGRDSDFAVEIRKLAPGWFVDTAQLRKDELLKLARSGKSKRPNRKTSLGRALNHYTSESSGSYDSGFDAEIRGLAPGWFRR